MVKLNELPPEIVEMVVRVGSDTEKRAQNRYEDLKSFARISPIFQYPAQRLMNERVVLRNVSTMASWLEERREDFVVKELTFESEDEGELEDQPDDLSMADMQRTIRTCPQGLQKLSILVIDDIEGSILSETNLKDLTSLIISPPVILSPNSPLRLAFASLSKLDITLWSSLHNAVLDVDCLESILRTNRIASLTLSDLHTSEILQLTSMFDLAGPHLRKLRLHSRVSLSDAPIALLAGCTVLEFLQIDLESPLRLQKNPQTTPESLAPHAGMRIHRLVLRYRHVPRFAIAERIGTPSFESYS